VSEQTDGTYDTFTFTYHATRYRVELPEDTRWPLYVALADVSFIVCQRDKDARWIMVSLADDEASNHYHVFYATPVTLLSMPRRVETIRVTMRLIEKNIDSMDMLRDTGLRFDALERAIDAQKFLWYELHSYLRNGGFVEMKLPKGW
jgi:hypothetical protein